MSYSSWRGYSFQLSFAPATCREKAAPRYTSGTNLAFLCVGAPTPAMAKDRGQVKTLSNHHYFVMMLCPSS